MSSKAVRVRLDPSVSQKELDVLRALKVGDIRKGVLMAALPTRLEWECLTIKDNSWELEGRFCGVPFMRVEITEDAGTMTLEVK